MNSTQKKQKYQQINTIDETHTEMMNHFHHLETNEIPKLLNEKKKLKQSMKQIDRVNIDAIMNIQDKIRDIDKHVKELKTKKKKYLLDNSKYIFQYFEDKKKISFGDNNQNINKVNSFFKIKESNISHKNIYKSHSATGATVANEESYMVDISLGEKENTRFQYRNYWKNVKNEIPNIQEFVLPSDICEYCKEGEMIPQEDEGILICNNSNCSKFITYIVDSTKPANKEPPNEVSYTAYIRLNHFKEILSQFQAKETTQIPPEVIKMIRDRIKKERIEDVSELNYDTMREILRKLDLNKYFEHIQYINSIFGIKPPIMNEELHETLCVLFIEIQGPWAIHCPPNRTNFFNYTYTLYQLCTLLGQTQYLPYIPLLKDRTKQLEQDMIWKKVCETLDWEFIPTI
jgi:hypothetical protein